MNAIEPSETLADVTARLLAERNAAGHWEGELSSSALSTATALFALRLYARHAGLLPLPVLRGRAGVEVFNRKSQIPNCKSETRTSTLPRSIGGEDKVDQLNRLIEGGVAWLVRTQNPDGGFGDTIRSCSNISTTALCWAALAESGDAARNVVTKVEAWLIRAAGSLDPKTLAQAIGNRYGKDRTFSVPILTMCALAGRLGEGREAWRHIPQLPFELAACSYRWFQIIRLPVVSYALPALIAMGHARHARRPTRNPVTRLIRWLTRDRTLRVLESIQPRGGGFLEATPLTSFVVMSLIGAGYADHPVVREGVEFLMRSVRADGSWPIDTNLATWVTTLSINALGAHPDFELMVGEEDRRRLRDWLLGQQYKVEHPYTHAAPGGWAWTDLPGGVPDADDTAGALIALRHLSAGCHGHVLMPVSSNVGKAHGHEYMPMAPDSEVDDQVLDAIANGVKWLLDLQNRDGGIPTFCRGWGALPFDRSGSDLTAHALHAWVVWKDLLPADLRQRMEAGTEAGIRYLRAHQSADGAWSPLWFGNEACADERNLTYGTSRVVAALTELAKQKADDRLSIMIRRGVEWLKHAQNPDGSWGGGVRTRGSVEETSLALQALLAAGGAGSEEVTRGFNYLRRTTGDAVPSPIGFYFAKLWYFEKLYPLIFQVGAEAHRAGVHRFPR